MGDRTWVVIGNGVTAMKAPKQAPSRILCGVHRAWKLGPLDAWLSTDAEPFWEGLGRVQAGEVYVHRSLLTEEQVPHLPRYAVAFQKSRSGSLFHEEDMHGAPGFLLSGWSSVIPALHLGLIRGFRRFELYGVDLKGGRFDGSGGSISTPWATTVASILGSFAKLPGVECVNRSDSEIPGWTA